MKEKNFLLFTFLFVFLFSTMVVAWGPATHTHYANKLGSTQSYMNLQEIYGSTLPDVFNLAVGIPGQNDLAMATHEEFMPMADKAWSCYLKAIAYGFVSHNDVWGADYTAHWDSQTSPESGPLDGWVETKIPGLKDIISDPISAVIGDNLPPTTVEEIIHSLAHDFIETGMDILVREVDPKIGYRLLLAAQLRAPGTPYLLASAYAKVITESGELNFLQASAIIIQAEKEYRNLMKTYGLIFTQEYNQMMDNLSELGAQLITAQLSELGLQLIIQKEMVLPLLQSTVAYLSNEGDYVAELNATLDYLEGQMAEEGFYSNYSIFSKVDQLEENQTITEPKTPLRFALEQNYPNPFNPVTTIQFSLAEAEHVKLVVYNSLGQQIATLVDRVCSEGIHQIEWNAGHLSTGTYIYRIHSKSFTATKKMYLLK
jgi:hypothetical protein